MKNIIFHIFFGALVLTMFSCARHRPIFKNFKSEQGNYSISYDASKRGSIISIDKDGKIDKILAEVQPDVALSNAIDFTSKLKKGESFDAEQITKITESLTILGERTAAVNILRDALFRLEEHCINFPNHCNDDKYWSKFESILNTIKEIQITSQVQAKEKTVQSQLKLEQLKKEERLRFGIENQN